MGGGGAPPKKEMFFFFKKKPLFFFSVHKSPPNKIGEKTPNIFRKAFLKPQKGGFFFKPKTKIGGGVSKFKFLGDFFYFWGKKTLNFWGGGPNSPEKNYPKRGVWAPHPRLNPLERERIPPKKGDTGERAPGVESFWRKFVEQRPLALGSAGRKPKSMF